ncbi:hypothetical protein G9A89_023993 [Geosiphon pyriformis]|nr:hypothetical protein G9A89_023993 [Geosiphon pyriformis]
MESKDASISRVFNLENMTNIVAEEISFVDSNDFEANDMVDNTTSKKTKMKTYVLGQLPKRSSFNNISDVDDILELSSSKFGGSNQEPSTRSHVLMKHSFEPVKLFTLDVKLSVVPKRTNSDKSFFTSEISLNKTRDLAVSEKILINNDVRQSVFMGKDSVCVAKTIDDKKSWVFRDLHHALLYTFLVGMTAHDFSGLLKSYSEKTCFIGHNLSSYVHDKCAIVCFVDEASKVAAIGSTPVFKSVNLCWAGLSLACCACCKQFGHISDVRLMGIYKRKQISIAHPVFFVAGGSSSHVAFLVHHSAGLPFVAKTFLFSSAPPNNHDLYGHLASLKHSLELLADQVSGILKKLGSMELVSLAVISDVSLPVVSVSVVSGLDLDMVLDSVPMVSTPFFPVVNNAAANLSSSSSKVLTTKVGGLESKMVALEVSVESVLEKLDHFFLHFSMNVLVWKITMCNIRSMNNLAKQDNIIYWHKEMNNLISIVIETKLKSKIHPWIINKFDEVQVFTSGLESGHLSSGVVIIIDISLAKHVCKVSEVPGWLLSLKLLFKDKLSVSILGFYASASLVVQFFQAGNVNSMIARAINKFSFVVLGGNFNEDGSHKNASFKKCLDLGLVNSLSECSYVKELTWANSCGVAKMINFLFISLNLANAVVGHNVFDVGKFFDIDHQAIFVSVGLDGLLNIQLNSTKWKEFGIATSANAVMFSNKFATSVRFSDLDAMWDVVRKIVILLANKVFKKKWFKSFNDVFIKDSSRYYKLELLVSKIVKTFREGCVANFDSLMKCWVFLDNVIVDSGADSGYVCSALFGARKAYHASKLTESLQAKEAAIRAAIDKRMESFEVNKSYTIRSVLEWLFRKVVLNHLVVGNELILKPDLVKFKVVDDISGDWCHQYQLLEYVFDEVFSGVISSIEFEELFGVVSSLPDGKATGLSGISNKLWKHCDKAVLDMFLVFLNFCLSGKSVPGSWKEAWTACKILSKIFSDSISLACSAFDVFRKDNFSVLKGTMTQFPIFAIELWLILQDIKKTYNSVDWKHLEKSLIRIKMCSKFICFFGSIYRDCINCIMTDFGLTGGYQVHNDLDQREVFSPLLWYIFYDPLLCKIKHQKSVYEYRLDSHFISKSNCTDFKAGLTFFFAAGAFVNNTIWVGSSWNATQHILDVASEFFQINNISINNDKTVAIPINSKISNSSLFINDLPISITKKGESYQYLGIFLSTEGLSKPSLAKMHSDVYFFTNLVLKKAVSDKQFLYLVSAVLHLIVNALICKGLKLKSGLPLNFPSNMIHYFLFYGLKFFLQIQSKSKVALLVSFVNSGRVLGCLFSHQAHDFGFLANSFWFHGRVPMSVVLDKSRFHYGIVFMNQLHDRHDATFDWYTFKQWKRLDPRGPVPEWFKLSAAFFNDASLFLTRLLAVCGSSFLDILESNDFVSVCDQLSRVDNSVLSVYTDGSIKNLGTASCKAGAAAFFKDIGLSLGVGVFGLMFSILAELQAIALALKCAPLSNIIHFFSDSQSALDAYRSELGLRQHIVNVIYDKNLKVSWCKVKSHFGILGNKHADMIAGAASLSNWCLSFCLDEHFIVADYGVVSGNSRHFVHDIYQSICHARWEVSSGSKFLKDSLQFNVNWVYSSLVWHLDLHMAAGFTSRSSTNACTYFMKALHYHLPVAIRKHFYRRLYPSVLCLYYGDMEVSDHAFSCRVDESACYQLLDSHVDTWRALFGFTHFSSNVLQLLSSCTFGSSVFVVFFKDFVFNGWFHKAVSIFHDPKVAGMEVVKFVHFLSMAFRDDIWLVHAKHHAYMKRNSLIPLDSLVSISVFGLASGLSIGVLKLLRITDAFGINNPTLDYDDDDEFLYGNNEQSTGSGGLQLGTETTFEKAGSALYDPAQPTQDEKVEGMAICYVSFYDLFYPFFPNMNSFIFTTLFCHLCFPLTDRNLQFATNENPTQKCPLYKPDDDPFDLYGDRPVGESNISSQIPSYDASSSQLHNTSDHNPIQDNTYENNENQTGIDNEGDGLSPEINGDELTERKLPGEQKTNKEGDLSSVRRLDQEMADMDINLKDPEETSYDTNVQMQEEEEEEEEEEEPLEEEETDDSDIEIIMEPQSGKSHDNGPSFLFAHLVEIYRYFLARSSLVNIKLNQFNKPMGISRHDGLQSSNTSRAPAVDINAVGQIDGISLYDVDLDSFEDKPWRKPGADITDYFNYGFNEHTWRAYCAKQKQTREEHHLRKRINVFESKQPEHSIPEVPQEIHSMGPPQQGNEHPRFQTRGRGRRGRDHDDSVIQVVSSEREAALEELEPIPPPQMIDSRQGDEYGIQENGYPQDFPGPPMGVHMFGPPPEMGGPMGGPPPFFMGNPEMPPTGPMGFDPSFRGGQPMRQMMRNGGMPGMPGRMPPGMQGGMGGGIPGGMPGMPGRIPPGMPSGMPGGMMGRGRGMQMEERPYFSMEEPPSWEMENRNQPQYRPSGFANRPPTGPMHGPGGNRSDYHDWENSPPPDAPFGHRMRPPPYRQGGTAGPGDIHRGGRDTSVDSRTSDRVGVAEDERDRIDNRGGSGGGVERSYAGYDNREREGSRGYSTRPSREEDRWDVSRKRSAESVPRDDEEYRSKRRH